MQQDLSDPCWTIVAHFLPRADRFALLALCRSVVHSPLRRAFFAESTWCVPPVEWLATKVVETLTMKASIRAVRIEETWQQAYLAGLPVVTHVESRCGGESGASLLSWLSLNLKSLSLYRAELSVEELAALPNLTTLTLRFCTVARPNALTVLSRVTQLSLLYVRHQNDEWVASLPNLRLLRVEGTPFNPASLLLLDQLEELHLRGSDIEGLADLTVVAPRLKVLGLNDSHVELLADDDEAVVEVDQFFAGLTQIESLNLEAIHFLNDKLAPLTRLTTLSVLHLNDMFSDLGPLASLSNLEVLTICAVEDAYWSPIRKLKKLHTLNMNQYFDVENLSALRAIHDLPELRSLKNPPRLSARYPLRLLHELEVYTLSPYILAFDPGCCLNLTKLTVVGGFDLGSLVASFPKLKSLNLNYLRFCEDYRPLARLLDLEGLDMGVRPQISIQHGFSFLERLTRLISLDLSGTPIEKLSVVGNMKNLQRLVLDGTPIKDLSALVDLPSLREVSCMGCNNLRLVSSVRSRSGLGKCCIPAEVDCSSLVCTNSISYLHFRLLVHGAAADCV